MSFWFSSNAWQGLKMFFDQNSRLLYRVFAYTLIRKSKVTLSLFFKIVVNVVFGISKSLTSFATFVTFSLLSETTMSCFFPDGILLLFDSLRTFPLGHRPVARFYSLEGKIHFMGSRFLFLLDTVFEIIFSGPNKIWRSTKKIWGALHPWLRACQDNR